MPTLLGTLVYGVSLGCLYGLVGLGAGIIHSSSRVLDLARGQYVILAGLLAAQLEGPAGLPFLPVAVVCTALMALLGGVEYLVAIAPLRGDRLQASIVTTLGFGIALQAGITLVDSGTVAVSTPLTPLHLTLGSITISGDNLALIGAAVVITGVLWLLLGRSRTGLKVEAVAENPEVAALRGVSVRAVAIGSFVLAGAIAGLGGVIVAPVLPVQISYAPIYTIYGLVAMVVGGSGSLWGPITGGIAIGVLSQLGATYISPGQSLQELVGLGVFLAVLLLRPTGIIAPRRTRRT